jgi:transposase
MPAPVPVPVRQVLFQRWQKGASVVSLAEEFHLSERTVRHLVRRFAQRGKQGVAPDNARCAIKSVPTTNPVFQQAVKMREHHATWGAGLIRVILQEAEISSPCERTLQRWLHRATLPPAPPGRRPANNEQRARHPHDVWQMDAADQMRLAGDQRASWLRLVDECSGVVLRTTVFPPRVLEPGGTRGRPTGLASGIFPVGKARAVPSRQWHPLGIGG